MLRRTFCASVVAALSTFGIGAPRAAFSAVDTPELISKGWSKAELERILKDFEGLYRARLTRQISYTIVPRGPDEFTVQFPYTIFHPLMAYLVNYVQYPKGFNLAGRQVAVLGLVTLTAEYPIPSGDYVGKRARIYVPSDDHDFDLVYVAVGSEFFRQSFTFDRWEREADGRVPPLVKSLW